MTRLNTLAPNPKNPRKITEAKLEQLRTNLGELGDLGCFIYNRSSKQTVGGHQRGKVFGASKVFITRTYAKPTKTGTVAEGHILYRGERHKYREVEWDSSREKLANLAANKGAGEWDEEILGEWFKELSKTDSDLAVSMFDEEERKGFLDDTKTVSFEATAVPGEDEVPAAPKKVVTKFGDIIQLGSHRLMCADSTKKNLIEKLAGSNELHLVFTDPPYKMETKGGGLFKESKAMEGITRLGIDAFDPAVLEKHARTSIFFCNRLLIPHYIALARKWKVSWDLAVYHKQNITPNYGGHMMTDLEYIFILGHQAPLTGVGADKATYSKLFSGGKDLDNETAWSKPVALCEKFISLYAKKNVADLFGGTGSTLIACEKLSKRCFMVEIDPAHCDIIVARWEKFTGRKAKR